MTKDWEYRRPYGISYAEIARRVEAERAGKPVARETASLSLADILALRSVSPSAKLRMIAERKPQ